MAVSRALEESARDFCLKYACDFDFVTFESRLEEFTFLRPNNGWKDGYKVIFEQMYKKALVSAAEGKSTNLDGEAMLDDFEYTLIRPYVVENGNDINHKPYAGMDRITRLEYLRRLVKEAPSNPVALYIEKYKSGELSLSNMRNLARYAIGFEYRERERQLKVAGYVEALESVNKTRSFMWRVFHPFKNNAEKRDAALMRDILVSEFKDGESAYKKIVEESYETFLEHERAHVNIEYSMARAKEELKAKKKMQEAINDTNKRVASIPTAS